MINKHIPSTEETLPSIGLGTWSTFDVGNDERKIQKLKDLLMQFKHNEGKLIDSSPMYGSSEAVIGNIATDSNLHASLFTATKVWTTGKQAGIKQMDESFRRMNVKTIDLMQVHNLVDSETHLQTLREWKAAGKIRYIGITHYSVSAYSKLISLIKSERPDFVQFNYSIKTREAEELLLPVAQEHGVAVIINRPFEEGSLFSWSGQKTIPEFTKAYNINTWGQYFLKYIISHPAVTCVIPATSNIDHLNDFMQAGHGPMPDETVRKKMIAYLEREQQ